MIRTLTLAAVAAVATSAPITHDLLPNGAAKIPTVTIAPGVEMPMAGIGTWQYNDTVAGATVAAALKLGYTHIDTAIGYDNQVGIGKAIAASGRARSSYFLVSKIPGGLTEAEATGNLTASLAQLYPSKGNPAEAEAGAYVDLMLVHFPASWSGVGGKAARQSEWKAMEKFVKAGGAKAIGVSHYCKSHIEDILEIATIKPAVNQVQYHVGMGPMSGAVDDATDYKDYDAKIGTLYEGFSPLCGPCSPADHEALISGPMVTKIGKAHGKSGAQVSLKWQVQMGIPVIPKTSNPKFMAENIDLFSWKLTDAEMKELSSAKSPAVAGDKGPHGNPVSGDCDVA